MRLIVLNSFYKATTLCALFCVFALQSSYAAPAKSHSHNGRVHSHILPKTGVKHYHKHMHNGRAHIHPYSAKLGFKHTHNKSPRARAWANAVKHDHGGRPHSHPLPRSGTNHQHRHRHGGRSHIHPLPVSGANHFHNLKRKPNATSKPRMITGLSIKQQMAAVLGKPIPNNTKAHVVQRKVVQSKAASPSAKKTQRTIPVINQSTIKKVLGIHSHNGRTHQHPTQIAGAKHSHKKVVKAKQRKVVKKVATKKRTTAKRKPAQRRKTQRKIVKTKVVKPKVTKPNFAKKTVPKPVKLIPVPRRTKQSPQQIIEGNRQFTLALRYENGTGVKKNLPQAFNWYQRSANNGNAKAQFNLATLYENGEGTKQNIPQAIRWYTAAANNGDVNAQVNLGNRYAEGRNVPRNIQEAAKWYKRAADQGDLRGRANLNYLIEDNNGVIKR